MEKKIYVCPEIKVGVMMMQSLLQVISPGDPDDDPASRELRSNSFWDDED